MIVRFHRPVINVADMEQSLAFYRDILGLTVASDNRSSDSGREALRAAIGEAFGLTNPDLRWVILEITGGPDRLGLGREIELLQWFDPKPRPVSSLRSCYDNGVSWCAFDVHGVNELYDRLKKVGIQFLSTVAERQTPNGPRGSCRALDPDGYIVELHGTI